MTVAGVDAVALDRWLDDQDLPPGPTSELTAVGGGTQNVMARFERGGRRYVLRRPPLHPRPRSNDALRREIRVLGALADTPVPVPRVAAAGTDTDVLDGCVFYVMEEVDGFSPEVELPPALARDPEARHTLGLELARTAAALGEIDPEAAGLADLGRPEGFLARQVERWRAELASYAELGHRAGDLPHVDRVADWLEAHRPPAGPPGLMHGDLHLGNVLARRDRPQVAAVVDWEMVTVADPLLDLGWLLATGPGPDWGGVFAETPIGRAGGLPGRDDLVAAYAEASSRDVAAVDFYEVLACFKLGILLEGTHARAGAGAAPREVGDRLHAAARDLLARGRRRISRPSA